MCDDKCGSLARRSGHGYVLLPVYRFARLSLEHYTCHHTTFSTQNSLEAEGSSMNRIGSILSGLLLVLVATTVFAGPYSSDQSGPAAEAAPSSGSCQNRLGNNAYDCKVKSSSGDSFLDCFQFVSPGSLSIHFDLEIGGTAGCSCNPIGGFQHPRFDGSPVAFSCVGANGPDSRVFAGKVMSHKLKGKIADSAGDSYVFSCVKRSSFCP